MSIITKGLASVAEKTGNALIDFSCRVRKDPGSLRHRLFLLKQAIEQSTVSIVITDNDGIIEYVNPAFEKLTGYTREETLGQNPSILKSGSQDNEFYKVLWKTIKSGKTWQGQFHNKKKNGEHFWESASITPIQDKSGNIVNFIASKEDITRQRKREHDLKEAYSKVKAANDAKTSFLATMSHELRTPLNTIIGLTSVLQEQGQDTQTSNSLDYIHRSANHLLKLIQDLLNLNRIREDSKQLDTIRTKLMPLLCDVLQICSEQAKDKRIELQHEFDPKLPSEIFCDPTRLKQILINLVSNSIKYTECGYVKLSINQLEKSESGCRLEFAIIDTGMGIAKEHQEKIFDPFYQVDNSNHRRFGGAGLGLAICRRLVEQMGGDIRVESTINRGSCFSVNLELKAPAGTPGIYTTLHKPELDGLRIVSVLDPSPFSQSLKNIAEACTMFLDRVHPRELADINPLGIDLLIIDQAFEQFGKQFSEEHPLVPILWRGHILQHTGNTLPAYPLPDYLINKINDAILNSQHNDAQDIRPGEKENIALTLADQIPLRILAVDDIESNRRVIKVILEHLGYHPEFATGGEDFLCLVAQKAFDLVFLDLQMPDLDGMEAFSRLLDHPPLDREVPPVVALTANAQESTRQDCLSLGMKDYLTKPVDPDTMRNCIRNLFGNQMQNAENIEAGLLDHEHLHNITGHLPIPDARTMLKECMESLFKDFDKVAPTLKTAHQDKDDKKLIPIVHGLKGGLRMLGWNRAGDYCQNVLDELRAGTFRDYQDLYDEIQRHLRDASRAMNNYLAKLVNKASGTAVFPSKK